MKRATNIIIVSLLSCTLSGATNVKGPYPDGVPGSGFGCEKTCNGGDVNYVLEATLQPYTIKGSKNMGLGNSGNDVKMFTRTWQGIARESSPFCMEGKANKIIMLPIAMAILLH
jgi:hypothetical protein